MLKKRVIPIFALWVVAQFMFLPRAFCLFSEHTKPEDVAESRVTEQEKIKQQNILANKPQILPPQNVPLPAPPERGADLIVPEPKEAPAGGYNLIVALACLGAALLLSIVLMKAKKHQ